ncbi:transport-associated protein [Ancylobacter novellus DSM 506]|uniref:Transport-associated protein n=1 Tax=Ancylobacter novellus (strain ATCC 8093 / DSM 506 / JCM 20403 / CCM 1077 / IAM 12100 / NBRC 12443 / NCIMB 10456) TaxID=639283 RepID=D7A7R6_ANCN5|nr:transporter [Ancylobacter novellus]ADH88514.1 transport-associated protein [Ancylobacter novellus DSM 506]
MLDQQLYERLTNAVARNGDVDIAVSPEKRIITLTGKVPTRGEQIALEDTVGGLAEGFIVVNLVKVDPRLGNVGANMH